MSAAGALAAWRSASGMKDQVLYVEADLQRRPTPQIVADGVELVQQFKPDGFAIETNQFQELMIAVRGGDNQDISIVTHRPYSVDQVNQPSG